MTSLSWGCWMRRSTRKTGWGIAAGILLAMLWVAGPAAADDYVGTRPPEVGRVDIGGSGSGAVVVDQVSRPVTRNVQVSRHSVVRRTSGLALTGSDIMGVLFFGSVLVGTGVVLVRRTRLAPR